MCADRTPAKAQRRVLAIGGLDSQSNALASVEAYVESWAPDANLTFARFFHQAVLLSEKTVLVAGGQGSARRAINSTEIYMDGAWTPTGALNTPRYLFQMVILPTGQCLRMYDGTIDCNLPDVSPHPLDMHHTCLQAQFLQAPLQSS